MQRTSLWHGCLVAAVLPWMGLELPAQAGQVARVQSQVFDIEYSVNREALPLDSVVLWYTLDRGKTWHQYGPDEDRQSPFAFNAPQEGLYGFLFIMTNATGASSQPPTASVEAHCWAIVDFTLPVVQVHQPRQTTVLGRRVLQIRWTAIDTHLTDRPIEISYRRLPDVSWNAVAPDPLANTGRYDWQIADDFTGPVAIRVTVSDEGGNRVRGESSVIEIAEVTASLASSVTSSQEPTVMQALLGRDIITPVSASDRKRAQRLYEEGIEHRDNGKYREGIARLRRAVALDPEMTEAFVGMAEMFERIGDLDRSRGSYEIALRQKPDMREALRGAARVDQQLFKHESAAQKLRTILRHDPNDAEVWMNLGDVAIFQGDPVFARECYTYAATRDAKAVDVIESAQKRLVLMAEASRVFREPGS